METNQSYKDELKKEFYNLQTEEDLLNLINKAHFLNYKGGLAFDINRLKFYAFVKEKEKRYNTFSISKKSGGKRIINSPEGGLKYILRAINIILQSVYTPREEATGFIPGKSIVVNARKHIRNKYVYNIDLKDFFHSFDRNDVKMALWREPFNMKEREKQKLAFMLASLCTHSIEVETEERRVLPQGSPASPFLTNILCERLDRRLDGLSRRFGVIYSRYADDITFSASHKIFNKIEFQEELKSIIRKEGLKINDKKERLQENFYRQEVTGLVVNEKVNVKRRYVKELRMWLHFWEKFGYNNANKIFKKDYFKDKEYTGKNIPHLDNYVSGKLDFLKMVKGEKNSTYLSLYLRFRDLIEMNFKNNKKNFSQVILDKLVNEGLGSAVELLNVNKNEF